MKQSGNELKADPSEPAKLKERRGELKTTAGQISQPFPTPFLRSYAYWKVRTDPLYPAVWSCLEDRCEHPLFDLGCGMGLFAFFLVHSGYKGPIEGLDVDGEKVAMANDFAARQGARLRFACGDFSHWDSRSHQGHVCLLDVLQYLQPAQQIVLLDKAAACLTDPSHRLVIRNGLVDRSWRSRVSFFIDHFARWIRWMPSAALFHPQRDFLENALRQARLEPTIRPLWGCTPFNNYLIIARKV